MRLYTVIHCVTKIAYMKNVMHYTVYSDPKGTVVRQNKANVVFHKTKVAIKLKFHHDVETT